LGTRKKVTTKVSAKHRAKIRKHKRAREKVETPVESFEMRQMREAEGLRAERKARYEDRNLQTVGVRFANDPGKEYTYLVHKHDIASQVFLGMEVVVKSQQGNSRCCYITRVDDGVVLPLDYDEELKVITRRVVDL